ncbi:hypothetical protein ACYFX5_14720 [Bremerella sp. T1]|uniref:hypothetical protein n=1 Tax=Bremerella sp. TYQ1 TaxID=3119568 RepID=UPI001CC9F014|nr:hypothetical protein [Bremerella volcania]UBM34309.1 hypothetical protein LA756_16670 [Bremerella volcania]
MSENEQYQELRDYLRGENYSDIEIDHIIAQVEEYDAGTRVDSIMDSINSGDLDIQAVIDEALKKLAD